MCKCSLQPISFPGLLESENTHFLLGLRRLDQIAQVGWLSAMAADGACYSHSGYYHILEPLFKGVVHHSNPVHFFVKSNKLLLTVLEQLIRNNHRRSDCAINTSC